MINIKKLHFFPVFMVFYSCMEPVDEGLWSIDQRPLAWHSAAPYIFKTGEDAHALE